jgi:regulator of replication initiation timing
MEEESRRQQEEAQRRAYEAAIARARMLEAMSPLERQIFLLREELQKTREAMEGLVWENVGYAEQMTQAMERLRETAEAAVRDAAHATAAELEETRRLREETEKLRQEFEWSRRDPSGRPRWSRLGRG